MIQKGDYINPEGEKKTGYYPQVVRDKTVIMHELSEKASAGTTFSSLEVEVTLQLLLQQIERELLDSNHVCLDGFGTFSLTEEPRHVDHPNEIRAESIKVKRIVFVPSKIVTRRIKQAKFIRDRDS